jgi:hypothetical protein
MRGTAWRFFVAGEKGGSSSFLKKKNQKTFDPLAGACGADGVTRIVPGE